MPSWNNLTAPGYDQIGTSIDDLNVDASAFDNSNLISGKQTNHFSDFSGSFDTHFSTTELNKTYATHGRFDLGLGLADPRLQSVTQHLGFDPSHTERAANLTTATYEHPSLSIRPTLTVLPTTDGSRFRKLFQAKMAAEAGRQMSGQTPNPDQSSVTPQPESGSGGSRNPNWKSRSAVPSNGSGNNLSVNTAHAEELAGYRAEGDSAQDDLPRPKTSDGVVFAKEVGNQSVPPGEGHPVSADATIPIPLPTWQPSMASGVAGYRPQPQQSAYYQRMLAAKLGATPEDPLAAKGEENSYIPPAMSQTDMAFMPSSYSPMYQMFSNGGGLDPHYQAQHAPQGQNQQPVWNNQAPQAYGPGPNDPSYLGLFKNQSNDGAAPFPNNYPNGQQQQGPPGWNPYYAPNGTDARNPAGNPGPAQQQQQHQGGQGQWDRNGAKAEELAPPAVEDWMAAWPHIKNPGHDSGKPTASTSSTRKKTETESRAKKEGSVADSGKGGDQPKKAALACHFCRGRKLKCDAIRPTCSHCAKRSLTCSYDVEIRRRGPGKRKKELLAQQHARANGEPYLSEDDPGSSRKRKSGHGDRTDRDEDSQSDSAGLHSGIDMSVQPSSSGIDQYSQQAYSTHSMSAAPYSGGSHYGSEQYHPYNNQMYHPPPVDAYHNSGYMPPYHPQYEAVSNDRSRPVPQGYDQVGGGQSYGHGYAPDRPGGPDEHQSKRVKLEG